MTSKERVYRTLDFQKPDRVPVDIWTLKAAEKTYGNQLTDMIEERNPDICFLPLQDPTQDDRRYEIGTYVDAWGCCWHNRQYGIIGEVKEYPLADDDAFDTYQSPLPLLLCGRETMTAQAPEFLETHANKFILSGWNSLFERMQYLRGTENIFMDIASESDEFFKVRDIVLEYCCAYADICASVDGVDGCVIGDDWGTQISTLISPMAWKKLFKPAYKQIIDTIKKHGKRVFLHSDGYILPLYEEWMDLGVDAINSQLMCMNLEEVATKIKGKMTVWGELDRQHVMPHGTPEDVQKLIETIKNTFWHDGGVIGQFEVNKDMPIDNIRQGIMGW